MLAILIGTIITLVGIFDKSIEEGKRKNYILGGALTIVLSFIGLFVFSIDYDAKVFGLYIFFVIPIIFIVIGSLNYEKKEKKRDTDLIIAGSVLLAFGILDVYNNGL